MSSQSDPSLVVVVALLLTTFFTCYCCCCCCRRRPLSSTPMPGAEEGLEQDPATLYMYDHAAMSGRNTLFGSSPLPPERTASPLPVYKVRPGPTEVGSGVAGGMVVVGDDDDDDGDGDGGDGGGRDASSAARPPEDQTVHDGTTNTTVAVPATINGVAHAALVGEDSTMRQTPQAAAAAAAAIRIVAPTPPPPSYDASASMGPMRYSYGFFVAESDPVSGASAPSMRTSYVGPPPQRST
ncbi:hypothetical protein DFJ73DRAFT_763911 [Zopfochytrium polystomum]|nr:hypothetical protein DFJ73DRAFT_763911 [Zopfochytrium polystomum]